jgi:hypothetical protein
MIKCNYCNKEYKSLIDIYHHICTAKKVNWSTPTSHSKELKFLKSSIKINPR